MSTRKTLIATTVEPDPVMERVKVALRAASLDDVADLLGEKRATVGSWSARRSVPLHALVKTTEIAKCSLDWLVLDRKGPTQGGQSDLVLKLMDSPATWLVEAKASPQAGDGRTDGPVGLLQPRGAGAVLPVVLSLPLGEPGGHTKDYEVIPRHVRCAAAGKVAARGNGNEPADQVDLAGDMAFSFTWLKQNMGHTTGRLSSVQVRGDSMATTLLDGDTIIIDEGVSQVEVDGIYVFDFYGRRLVKRLQQLYDGTLLLISDNPNYQRETVPRDRARDVQVIGRMVWPRLR